MDPNDPATVAAVVAAFNGALVAAWAAALGITRIVQFFASVA